MKKRIIPALVLVLCLLPVFAAAAETRTEALYNMTIPAGWSPLQERTEESDLILNLTADKLYHLSADGADLIPSLAAGLPVDVTAAYAAPTVFPAMPSGATPSPSS